MRWPIVPFLALMVVAVSQTETSDREAEFRAALQAWHPRLFGVGSVVRGPLDSATVAQEGLELVSGCDLCPQVPFGHMNHAWQRLKRQIRPGDVWVFFRSDTRSWTGAYGREGYAILRNGKVVNVMISRSAAAR